MQVHLFGVFFSMVNSTVLHDPRLVECAMRNRGYGGQTVKLYADFLLLHQGLAPLTCTLFKGQLQLVWSEPSFSF